MQVGIHSALLGEAVTREALERVRAAGVDCVEFWLSERGLNPDRPADIRRIRGDLEAAAVAAWSVHSDFGPKFDIGGPYAETRRVGIASLLLAARVATEVGAQVVIVHPGVRIPDDEREARRHACRASLEQLLDESADLPVRFAVENMLPGHVGDRASELAWLLEGLPQERIGFCYDTGHARLCPDGLEVARCMTGRAITIHLQDNVGEGDAHLMPFDGTLDWPLVARMLDEMGYAGPYMFETALPIPQVVIHHARDTAQRLHDLRAG